MTDFVARTRKAWIGAAGTAGALLPTVVDDGVTLAEAALVAGAFVGVFLVTFFVPNRTGDVVR